MCQYYRPWRWWSDMLQPTSYIQENSINGKHAASSRFRIYQIWGMNFQALDCICRYLHLNGKAKCFIQLKHSEKKQLWILLLHSSLFAQSLWDTNKEQNPQYGNTGQMHINLDLFCRSNLHMYKIESTHVQCTCVDSIDKMYIVHVHLWNSLLSRK